MMKRFLILVLLTTVHHFATAEAKLESAEKDSISLGDVALSTIAEHKLNTVPRIEPTYGLGFRLVIDNAIYYIKPALFMLKSRPDEVCIYLGGNQGDSINFVKFDPESYSKHWFLVPTAYQEFAKKEKTEDIKEYKTGALNIEFGTKAGQGTR